MKILNAFILGLASIALMHCQSPTATQVQPHQLFTDNAVLQRDIEMPVWGTANPGGTVEVKINGQVEQTVVDEDSSWQVNLAAMEAGGPYQLVIRGEEEITLENVMVGDVWLASGQSNMEWPLSAEVDNYEEEIANANYPNIRLFTVYRNTSLEPLNQLDSGSWQECTPETVANFSAVAYFFGREIQQEQDISIGLLHSSWGGTTAEAWVSEASVRQMEDFSAMIDALRSDESAKLSFSEKQKLKEQSIEQAKVRLSSITVPLEDQDWPTMELPTLWENANPPLAGFDGYVWFQKTFTLPQSYENQSLTLHLGMIDDADITWVNGQRVGETEGYNMLRTYEIPPELVKAGENTITVRVLDAGGGGGFTGPADKMYLARNGQRLSVDIAGEWKYDQNQEGEFPTISSYPQEPTLLYNAMINPLLPYPIKGTIWYQGESNAGRAQQYQTLFPLLIDDWRSQWGIGDFPFLFVQLASFSAPGSAPENWPRLREAQAMTLSLPNTGMAVAIDIGDSADIHPRNKQDVGYRLALAARKVAYGEENVYSGPIYESMRVADDSVVLTFEHVGEGLFKMPDEKLRGFEVASEDQQFYPAQTTIVSDTEISVKAAEVARPAAVRYGWRSNPDVNLYNSEGLPASPFRTDDWEIQAIGS
ncbi:MAG: sialate O-acetylesterase [Tunicatimonas sp.]|uniref:sialate O-acetylesterase n=1 Tax=Tunicatimonas sp. TaxID=1940096 RepID=UPI003C76EAD6